MGKNKKKETNVMEITAKILSDEKINKNAKKLLNEIISMVLECTAKNDKEQIKEEILKRALVDPLFKTELIKNPKGTLKKEYNLSFPESVEIVAVEETSTKVYLVIPHKYNDIICDDWTEW